MLISFVISSQGREEKIFKTINSLKKQTNSDYELIIINDDPTIEKEAIDFLYAQFEQNKNIIFVSNSKAQAASSNWNTGIKLSTGKYIAFIKEGDILEEKFVETISNLINKNKQNLDIIQFNQNFVGLIEGEVKNNLQDDVVYDLTTQKEVYAYISQNVYGKLFRLNYIKDFRIQFRRSVRFDTLFLFKALGHARTYYQISEVLATHRMNILKYSAFDLVNQWPHILNYYRRIGTYKDLRDELNYAHFYELGFDFLRLVKKFDNKQLYKKALRYSESKIKGKLKNFLTTNQVFLQAKDQEFNQHMQKFDSIISSEIRKVGR